jgi:signal transduction histidine kinase
MNAIGDVLKPYRWFAQGIVAAVIILLVTASSYPSDSALAWRESFDADSLEGWVATIEGRMNHRIALRPEGRKGSGCLQIEADVEDKTNTDSRIILRYDLAANGMPPIVAGDSTVLQFEWWLKDDFESGPVTVGLLKDMDRSIYHAQFGSHQRFAYGALPVILDDHDSGWIVHRLRRDKDWAHIGKLLAPADTVIGIEIEVRYPINQMMLIDNISVGPASEVALPDSVRIGPDTTSQASYHTALIEDIDEDGYLDAVVPTSLGVKVIRGGSQGGISRHGEAVTRGLRAAGLGSALFADFDNDGDQDLFVINDSDTMPVIYPNDGHGYFGGAVQCCDSTRLAGNIASMVAADFNRDGYLDVYLATNDYSDNILMNTGGFRFEDADSMAACSITSRKRAQGATAADFDNDGDQDLYVASLGVLLNDGEGRFDLVDLHWHGFYEGVLAEGGAVEDLNNDRNLDIYVAVDQERKRTDLPSANMLFCGDGAGGFELMDSLTCTVADTNHCESAPLGDYDNDGDVDIFLANRGKVSECYINDGHGNFALCDSGAIPSYQRYDVVGSATADMDRDGDLDVICITYARGWKILENSTNSDRYIRILLKGTTSNWDAIGARVELFREPVGSGDPPLAVREVRSTQGFQISTPKEIHFGLPYDGLFTVRARFPSGIEVVRSGVGPATTMTMVESMGLISSLYWNARRLWLPGLTRTIYKTPAAGAWVIVACCALIFGITIAGSAAATAVPRWLRRKPIGAISAAIAALTTILFLTHNYEVDGILGYAVLSGSAVLGFVAVRLWPILLASRTESERWERLNDELISYRHTEWSENLASLARLGAAVTSQDLTDDQKAKLTDHWDDAVTTFESVTAKKLHSICNLAQSVSSTRSIATEVTRHLDGVLDRVSRNEIESTVIEAKGLMAATTELADMVDHYLSCRYAAAIETALKGAKVLLAEHEVEITPEFDPDSRAKVRILDHELTAILQDLVRNAVEAMLSCDKRKITVRASEMAREVKIEIVDTGKGLGDTDPETIFEKGVTTKPLGSGFGLYYARRALRRYRGNVTLSEREDGPGTVASVVLKRAKDA